MCSTSLICAINFLLFLNTLVPVASADSTSTTPLFDEYGPLLQSADFLKIHLAQAIWAELRASAFDLNQYETFLRSLQNGLQFEQLSLDQQLSFDKLYAEVRDDVIAENSIQLAQNFFDRYFVDSLINKLSDDPAARRKVFANAIDLMYGLVDNSQIAVAVYLLNMVNRSVTLDAELYLYWKLQRNGDIDEPYMLLAAYYFSEIAKSNASSIDRRRVKKAIATLPLSVRLIIENSDFCVQNAKYNDYLYVDTTIAIDAQRNFIFAGDLGQNSNWNIEIFWSQNFETDEIIIKSNLLNSFKQLYLYRDDALEHNTMAASNDSASSGSNNEWQLTLSDDKIVFIQADGARLCAVDTKYDDNRRYVQVLRVDNDEDERCAWIIDVCPA